MLKAFEVHNPAGVKTKVEEIMRSDPDEGLRDRAKRIINQLP